MKSVLQALLIAPDQDMRSKVLTNQKSISIREGHRDYKIGPIMLCCHLVPWSVMAQVISVTHCTLQDVTEQACIDDGFASQVDLLAGLKRHYPSMTLNSPVTIIRWNNIQGFFADHVEIYEDSPYRAYRKLSKIILES